MTRTHAYAYADGVIHFGASVPPGALPIADGVESDLVRAITGSARLAYDNETWLVPGIPEAADQKEGVDALIRYRKRVLQTLARIDEEEGADG